MNQGHPGPGWGERFQNAYEAAAAGAAAFPAGREFVAVEGPDALQYLNGQLSQDLLGMQPGSSVASLLLSPQGKLLSVLRVTMAAEDRFVLDFDSGSSDQVIERLMRFKLRSKLTVSALNWTAVALRGPTAGELVEGLGTATMALPVQLWPEGGFDLAGEDVRPPEGATIVPDAVAEALRIEAGVAKMGAELSEKTIPAEAGLVEPTVSFTKGCYVGQELVARIDARGSNVPRRLVWVACAEAIPPRGAEIVVGDKVVGNVTSSAWSPRADAGLCLAYLRREVSPPAPVLLRWEDEHRNGQAVGIDPSALATIRDALQSS